MIDRDHKAAVAQLFCIATSIRAGVELYGVHVAHLRFSNAAAGARNPGLQRKPDDRWVLPLSPMEHRRQHAIGEQTYWTELGVDPHAIATALWTASPQGPSCMLAVLRLATAASSRGDRGDAGG